MQLLLGGGESGKFKKIILHFCFFREIAYQRLIAALHYGVGELGAQQGSQLAGLGGSDITFDKAVLATIAQLAFQQLQTVGGDCEAFAK